MPAVTETRAPTPVMIVRFPLISCSCVWGLFRLFSCARGGGGTSSCFGHTPQQWSLCSTVRQVSMRQSRDTHCPDCPAMRRQASPSIGFAVSFRAFGLPRDDSESNPRDAFFGSGSRPYSNRPSHVTVMSVTFHRALGKGGPQHGRVAGSALSSGRACPTAVIAFCPSCRHPALSQCDSWSDVRLSPLLPLVALGKGGGGGLPL